MLKKAIVAVSAVLALQAASAQAADGLRIPARFLGEFNTNLRDCGTGKNDSRLQISADVLRFYESSVTPKELLTLANGDLVILGEHEGEGEKWTSILMLSISSDSSALTITNPHSKDLEQSASRRLRCR